VKFDLIRFRNAADGWVQDVRLSEKETCALLDLFCSRVIAGFLAFIFEPGPENSNLIRLRDAVDGWV
jgi:hypothetical protein